VTAALVTVQYSYIRCCAVIMQVVGRGEAEESQRVPKNRSPDELYDSDRSRASTSGSDPLTPTALATDASTDERKGCEYVYLQDKQSECRKDPYSIDDPVAFKNSLFFYPVSKVLKDFHSADDLQN